MWTTFIFPHLWTDFKPLHNRAWMSRHLDVHYLHGGHFNIKYIFIKERTERLTFKHSQPCVPITEGSWFVPPQKNAKFTQFNF